MSAFLAGNGTHLHAFFDENVPDILFLDVHLATENGLELLKEIKEKYMSTKIIMVTADNSEESRKTAISYGADAYITKPFLPKHIMGALAVL